MKRGNVNWIIVYSMKLQLFGCRKNGDKTSTIVIGPPTANKTNYIARGNDGSGIYYKQVWKLEF